MAHLASNVAVHSTVHGTVMLRPDEDLPIWSIALISNPAVWDVPPTAEELAASRKSLDDLTARAELATTPVTDAELTRTHNVLHEARRSTADTVPIMPTADPDSAR